MFKIFKPKYTDRKTGQAVESETYYIRFTDHVGGRQRWPISPDHKTTHNAGLRIVELVRCRRDGDPLPPKLLKWVDGAPEDLRDRLNAAGVIDPEHIAKGEPLVVHLDGKKDEAGKVTMPGYRQHLTAGRTDREEYADLLIGRVKRIIDGCGFIHYADMGRPGAVTGVSSFLGKLRTDGEISGQTHRYYVRELKSFCRWMVAPGGRASMNAMEALKAVSDAAADKQETRALSSDEIRRVLQATAAAADWKGYTGAERALLYRFCYETGIRPGQVRKLTAGNFNLDDDPPTVTAKAATVKRRKQHTQALRLDMADELRNHLASKTPAAMAFHMPDKFTCAKMFRFDLSTARAAWIAEAPEGEERTKRHRSDFLADKDQHGRRVLFYSLRHSHGTALGDAGISQSTIAASLHHTKTSTTDRYIHPDLEAKARAVNALPNVAPDSPDKEELKATGTDGKRNLATDAVCLSVACPDQRRTVAFSGSMSYHGAKENPVPESETGFGSEGDGARTRNHRIDSPVL